MFTNINHAFFHTFKVTVRSR